MFSTLGFFQESFWSRFQCSRDLTSVLSTENIHELTLKLEKELMNVPYFLKAHKKLQTFRKRSILRSTNLGRTLQENTKDSAVKLKQLTAVCAILDVPRGDANTILTNVSVIQQLYTKGRKRKSNWNCVHSHMLVRTNHRDGRVHKEDRIMTMIKVGLFHLTTPGLQLTRVPEQP
jgi:DNA-binding Xre family transcriptional regulator